MGDTQSKARRGDTSDQMIRDTIRIAAQAFDVPPRATGPARVLCPLSMARLDYRKMGAPSTGSIEQVARVIPESTKLCRGSMLSASTRYQTLWLDDAPQRPCTVTPSTPMSTSESALPTPFGQLSGVCV